MDEEAPISRGHKPTVTANWCNEGPFVPAEDIRIFFARADQEEALFRRLETEYGRPADHGQADQ